MSKSYYEGGAQPMPFKNLSQLDGPLDRHIEQLWDEIKKLKERVLILEKEKQK